MEPVNIAPPNDLIQSPREVNTLHICLTIPTTCDSVRAWVRTQYSLIKILIESRKQVVRAQKSFKVGVKAKLTPHEWSRSQKLSRISTTAVLFPCPMIELVVHAGFWKQSKAAINSRLLITYPVLEESTKTRGLSSHRTSAVETIYMSWGLHSSLPEWHLWFREIFNSIRTIYR